MLNEFKTVLKPSIIEMEEKKSRFISSVKPVQTEEQALEFINGLKTKYWDATHNVYAYLIGGRNVIQRFSDAGEPSGTAGLPVLEVIRKIGLQDIVIVITRYFGGTLLGSSGLIRTYGRSASLGIEAAVIVKRILCKIISIIMEYTMFGKLHSFISSESYPVKDIIYSQDVEILAYIPHYKVENFISQVIELSNDRVVLEKIAEVYITIGLDGKLITVD